MKDQRAHWNHAHSERQLHKHSTKQTSFAEEVGAKLPPNTTILELGCGEGNDSIYFAELGHTVVATDFSDMAVTQNKQRWSHPNLTFKVQDTGQPLLFNDSSFHSIYARLSLHYFDDETTRKIFREISRVLKPGGILGFMCKTVDDDLHGKGNKIETNMYELDGHVRHFFSKDYVLDLLSEAGLLPEYIESGKDTLYDRQSAFIKVIARKPLP